MGQSWSRLQQKKNAKSLLELAPKKTPGQDEPLEELDRGALLASLKAVAAYITKKKGNVTVIAVGGAVNTIYLQSRTSTHDVDFFNNRLTPAAFKLIVEGAAAAAKANPKLDAEWFNNRTILFIPRDQRDTLTEQSYAQNEIIFQEPGLTVLAAPWQYAFCCKVDRVAGGGIQAARPYDVPDAVNYLRRYLSRQGKTQVPLATVKEWFTQYSLRWTANCDIVVAQVNAGYKKLFKVTYNAIA
ncbi:uncharacterized protein C8A04DRAFT_29835 [Dichotomopilus funicola]|uniref:DUF7582 domain-containing protein n=1 Tax=Dichotomopilus funicola TaxID=1934379 RepID=A0AAN6V0J1_9PEZI|nr:hypothetical protein C8A04DRAFT_29835 [Dichotomopilus funicola]